ncbi:PKAR [Symbiodinium sp. CCMP2456]|nr:PKAR [Symbiodinium sp. CCMP2456]
MDLSAAFDLARWEHVKTALDLAGTPLHLQDILLPWLTQVKYIFHHRDCSGKIHPKWGLRQGCTASPILWSAFTALLCVTLEDRLGENWTRQHATLYADDSHLRWKFLSYAQFERTMQEVKIAFNVFRSFHMKLNVEKTKAIIKVVGTMRSKIHKEHIRKINSTNTEDAETDKQRLLLSPRDPTNWLPLVTQTEYLGLVISYGPFELQSLRHRVAKANNRRWAMASILHSRKLGVGYKLCFWKSCVLSILTYGLRCCGLTGDNVQEAQRAMMRHVRAIVSNQAHLTGDTHDYIMNKYGIQCLIDQLRAAHDRERQAAALQNDWMWSEDWSQYVRDSLEQVLEPTQKEVEHDIWSCPKCEATFGTAAALKTHARRAHDIKDERPVVFNKAEHALGGLPTCSKCHKKFSKWQTLAQHINQNSCPQMIVQPMPVQEADAHMNMPATNLSNATTQVLCQRTEVVRASQKGINAFIQLSDIRPLMRQNCVLCGQWCTSHRTVKRHYQYSHPDILQVFGNKIKTLVENGHSQSYLPLLMLADPDLNEFFGEVSQEQSLKRRRPAEDSKGQGKGQAQKNKGGKNDELVTTLARLALRQEEELQVLKQDHSFMMFMKPGLQPARQVLALALFRELASRLELLGKEDKDRKPLTTAEVKHSLEKLYAAVKTGVVTRFSCARKLTETMENQASFYFDLSGRGAGIEAWEHMEKLEGCCVLQLVGLAYKRAGLRRGPLAQKLRELLGQR